MWSFCEVGVHHPVNSFCGTMVAQKKKERYCNGRDSARGRELENELSSEIFSKR